MNRELDVRHMNASPASEIEPETRQCKDSGKLSPVSSYSSEETNGTCSVGLDIERTSFIEKVFYVLENAAELGFGHVISWEPNGLAFKVRNVEEFESVVLPRYLRQTKLRSFQRQLIKHGFTRIQGGAGRGAYKHPKFIQNDRESSLSITRIRSRQPQEDAPKRDIAGLDLGNMSHHFKQAVEESQPRSFLQSRHRRRAESMDMRNKKFHSCEGSLASNDGSRFSSLFLPSRQDAGIQTNAKPVSFTGFSTDGLAAKLVTPCNSKSLLAACGSQSSSQVIPLVSNETSPRCILSERLDVGDLSEELELRIFAPCLAAGTMGMRPDFRASPRTTIFQGGNKQRGYDEEISQHLIEVSSLESCDQLATAKAIDDFTPLDINTEVDYDAFWGL